VIVRADLPIGFACAQIVHAAGESSPGNLSPGTNAVVLAARNEAELAALERKLAQAGIPHVAIREPDPPWNGALTAIGLVPTDDRRKLKPLLSSLPLLGKPAPCPDCEAVGGICYTHNGGLRRVAMT